MKISIIVLFLVAACFVHADSTKWKKLTKSEKSIIPIHSPLSFDLINYVNYVVWNYVFLSNL